MIFSAAGLSTAPLRNVLDEGMYAVQINKCEGIVSRSEKQCPGISFESVVVGGPIQMATQTSPEGRRLSWTIWIPAEQGNGRMMNLQRLAKLCKALDIERTEDLDLDQFVGRTVEIRIAHEDFNGEPQEKVIAYKKIDTAY